MLTTVGVCVVRFFRLLKINHRLGYEYVEHAMVAVASGTTCLVVFRGLAGLPIGAIWQIESTDLPAATASWVLVGAALGLLGAGIAAVFTVFHVTVGKWVTKLRLDSNPVKLALIGGVLIALLGMLVPQSMFWGEFEFNAIATLGAAKLTHIWPTQGLTNFQLTSATTCFVAGTVKLVAISFTVWGGFRGGYM